eukprot:gene21488-25847_t
MEQYMNESARKSGIISERSDAHAVVLMGKKKQIKPKLRKYFKNGQDLPVGPDGKVTVSLDDIPAGSRERTSLISMQDPNSGNVVFNLEDLLADSDEEEEVETGREDNVAREESTGRVRTNTFFGEGSQPEEGSEVRSSHKVKRMSSVLIPAQVPAKEAMGSEESSMSSPAAPHTPSLEELLADSDDDENPTELPGNDGPSLEEMMLGASINSAFGAPTSAVESPQRQGGSLKRMSMLMSPPGGKKEESDEVSFNIADLRADSDEEDNDNIAPLATRSRSESTVQRGKMKRITSFFKTPDSVKVDNSGVISFNLKDLGIDESGVSFSLKKLKQELAAENLVEYCFDSRKESLYDSITPLAEASTTGLPASTECRETEEASTSATSMGSN